MRRRPKRRREHARRREATRLAIVPVTRREMLAKRDQCLILRQIHEDLQNLPTAGYYDGMAWYWHMKAQRAGWRRLLPGTPTRPTLTEEDQT